MISCLTSLTLSCCFILLFPVIKDSWRSKKIIILQKLVIANLIVSLVILYNIYGTALTSETTLLLTSYCRILSRVSWESTAITEFPVTTILTCPLSLFTTVVIAEIMLMRLVRFVSCFGNQNVTC